MRTLARLAHAGLVTVFDAGTDDDSGRPYLVMQLVEGSTLAEQLRHGPLARDANRRRSGRRWPTRWRTCTARGWSTGT